MQLPVPGAAWPVVGASGADLVATEFLVGIHPDLPKTVVWGYRLRDGHPAAPATYLGPTLVATPGEHANVKFTNALSTPLFPADPALLPMGVDPAKVRLNTHQHGGRVDDHSDGNPFDAYGGGEPEILYASTQTQAYPNAQSDALLWYHDHALGTTRTNVYSGLAGGYVLTDGQDNARNLPFVGGAPARNFSGVRDLHSPTGTIPLDIPLVLQDRDLSSQGALLYPYPWVPEFFGKVALVNGKAYPFLPVEPRKYRFRFLNGSQSRFYNLVLSPAKKLNVVQVGVELGFLDTPFSISGAAGGPGSILIAPAERADVIVDFSGLKAGQTVALTDVPLPAGVVSPTRPIGDIMQFRVVGTKPASDFGDPILPHWLPEGQGERPGGTGRPGAASRTSLITLDEILAKNGKPLMAVMNNTPFMQRDEDGVMQATPDAPFSTEVIPNGATHEWKFLNLTADTHPIHLHLAHFEVTERQAFDAAGYQAALIDAGRVIFDPAAPTAAMRMDPAGADGRGGYPPIEPFLLGTPVASGGDERGPKDTVRVNPGEVTTIKAVFHPPAGEGRYVYHCHILEHEENEMMRPFAVVET